jgi:hypothetical protein
MPVVLKDVGAAAAATAMRRTVRSRLRAVSSAGMGRSRPLPIAVTR